MIFKTIQLINNNLIDEAKDFITITLNKLLQEEKFSLVDLIILLFIRKPNVPELIYWHILNETSGYRDKLNNRKKMEEILNVCA